MKNLLFALLIAIQPMHSINEGIENTLTVDHANRILNIEEGDSYSRCVFGMTIGNGYHVTYNPCNK